MTCCAHSFFDQVSLLLDNKLFITALFMNEMWQKNADALWILMHLTHEPAGCVKFMTSIKIKCKCMRLVKIWLTQQKTYTFTFQMTKIIQVDVPPLLLWLTYFRSLFACPTSQPQSKCKVIYHIYKQNEKHLSCIICMVWKHWGCYTVSNCVN